MTEKERIQLTAVTVKEMNICIEAAAILKGNPYFNYEKFKDKGLELMLRKQCTKRGLRVDYVKKIAGSIEKWK